MQISRRAISYRRGRDGDDDEFTRHGRIFSRAAQRYAVKRGNNERDDNNAQIQRENYRRLSTIAPNALLSASPDYASSFTFDLDRERRR